MWGYKRLSDHKMVEEIRNGNQEVLVSLYRNSYTMVRNFILRNSGTEDEIDDVLQDSLIAVWQNVNKPDFMLKVKMSTYLMSIVKNLWFKRLKKKSKFTRVDETAHIRSAYSEDFNFTFDKTIIRKMVEEMDEACRKLLSYFYFDGFENKVIAEKLGYANTDTVKSKKYQCFSKLKKIVNEQFTKDDFFG